MMALFESPVKTVTNDMKRYFPVFERKAETSVKKQRTSRSRVKCESEKKSRSCVRVRRKLPLFRAGDQYALDLGQKDFDPKRCSTCNMLFTTGEVVDELTHSRYHDMFVNSLQFKGWKHEDVVAVFEDGRVVRVLPEHRDKHKYMIRKVDELFKVADIELGINLSLDSCGKPSSVYLLFVAKTKRIAGFVASEQIKCANRLTSEDPLMASTDEEEAKCGIARIWTHPNYRRQKIATRLIDTLRANFIAGQVIKVSDIAFSDPTIDGKDFAKKYSKRNDFLVYSYQSV